MSGEAAAQAYLDRLYVSASERQRQERRQRRQALLNRVWGRP